MHSLSSLAAETNREMEQRNDSEDGEESVRIHVGGLGPSVISSDLMQTFSSIATVSSLDIIRTKGRNFAYITFRSPSPQAIKRIFTLVSPFSILFSPANPIL